MNTENAINIDEEELKKIIDDVEQVIKKEEQSHVISITDQADNSTSSSILDALKGNEDGDARLFIELNQGKYLYYHSIDKWFVWTGNYWEVDDMGKIYDGFGSVIQKYVEEAGRQAIAKIEAIKNQNDTEKNRAAKLEHDLLKRLHDIQTRGRKQNILKQVADGIKSISITGDVWDTDPYLLGCRNGVIELKTGKFRPGQPGDLIRTIAPIDWLGIDTPAPMWEKFISEIFEQNEAVIKFMQRVFGYSIAGLTLEHILIILQGEDGRNGKGTMLETLKHVLGELAWPIGVEMLLRDPRGKLSSAASPEYVALKGKRIIWASEIRQGLPLGLAKVKLLTGGDTIVCRPLNKDPLDFAPTHTVFLLSNPRPQILEADDEAFWDRVHLIPFNISFKAEPHGPNEKLRDINLPEKLRTEAPGILAWLVRGFLEWQRIGLQPPDVIKKATLEYRMDEDVVKSYFDECIKKEQGKDVKASNLHEDYMSWAIENDKTCLNITVFGKRVAKIVKKVRKTDGYYYKDIRFLTKEEKEEQEKLKHGEESL